MKDSHPYTNSLIHESSPYLLQHAHNPVDWYPWGEKALQKALDEDKMLIISIGYAACHWCHVMEHESFEDTTVARLMNEHFVSIKVDREERPDVDQVYMNAAQILTGRGGWPLNAIALPDGKPFFAGTYFPKEDWMKILNHLVNMKENEPKALIEQAEKVSKGIQSMDRIYRREDEKNFDLALVEQSFNKWQEKIDRREGGRKGAPKFPMPTIWKFLLQYSTLTDNAEAMDAVTTTLDKMAMGGIFDHLGGGFARYSTDEIWLVPHFEKMLYDNAQLVSLYSKAYQKTQKPLYKKVVYETLDFIQREMRSPEGGFYSSLDADSEGEEGKYYVWSIEEIEHVLGENAPLLIDYYNLTKGGNWEHGKNILHRTQSHAAFAKKHNLSVEALGRHLASAKSLLFEQRATRVRPGLDDKILTSWNALMLRGYIHAYRTFGEEKFLTTAVENTEFLLENTLSGEGDLTRNHKDGKSSIHAFLDDYAFLISALIELYQATFEEEYLLVANELMQYSIEHFYDSQSGMFFYTHAQHSTLISRKKEISDNVIPSSNSEMAKNLFQLGTLLYEDAYLEKSRQLLANVQKQAHEYLGFYANWLSAETHFAKQPYEIAIVGEKWEELLREFDKHFLPNAIFLGGETEGSLQLLEHKLQEGQTTIYVCQNKACKLPVQEVSEALKQMQ